jgi:hypothetical protein
MTSASRPDPGEGLTLGIDLMFQAPFTSIKTYVRIKIIATFISRGNLLSVY